VVSIIVAAFPWWNFFCSTAVAFKKRRNITEETDIDYS
jgi:hypothetical protein